MNISWFKNPDNVVHIHTEVFAERFWEKFGVWDLKSQIDKFKEKPTKEGKIIKGTKRSSIRLFIPDLIFDERIEAGEKVWVYIGEFYPCYVLD